MARICPSPPRLNPEMWAFPHARGDENPGAYPTALSLSAEYLAA